MTTWAQKYHGTERVRATHSGDRMSRGISPIWVSPEASLPAPSPRGGLRLTSAPDRAACVAPVLSVAEARQHPHQRARGLYVEVGGTPHPRPAPRFGRTDAAVENARWVRESHHSQDTPVEDCNSSTEVYLLVERLLGKPG